MPVRSRIHTSIALIVAVVLGLLALAVSGVAADAKSPDAPAASLPRALASPWARQAARSWYVSGLTGDLRADVAHASARGCWQAQHSTPGLVVLGFGRQMREGVSTWKPRRPTPLGHVVHIAAGFASGLSSCSEQGDRWVLTLAVSNSGGATPWNGANGGATWAGVVELTARWFAATSDGPAERVTIGGGIDMEPAWGPAAQGRAWVDAYVSRTSRMLVNFGSADLCSSKQFARNRCANGWTRDDIVHVSTAAGPQVWVAPEVYDAKGVMAGQWALIARRAEQLGTPLRFAGVMTQQAACVGATDPACAAFSLSSAEALTMLRRRLAAVGVTYRGLVLPTDIGWGWRH